MRRIDSVIENLEIEFSRKLKGLKDILIPLAIKTAEHILRAEIHIDPKVVEKQIEKALEIIDNEKIFKIRLNPADIEILKMLNSKFIFEPKLKEAKIIQDPNVDKGGCIIETEVGRIDARILSQLAKIETSLKNYPFSFGTQDV
ncbi:MAG: FliH/SctL family protein [Candidatus Kapaibacteriota bacterium]